MRVHEVMSRPVVTVSPDSDVASAAASLAAGRMHHLVVIEGKRVAGVLSDRDLADASETMKVSAVMNRRFARVASSATLREAAGKLDGQPTDCIVVIDEGKLEGVLTARDIVHAIARGSAHVLSESDRPPLRSRGSKPNRKEPVARTHGSMKPVHRGDGKRGAAGRENKQQR